MIIERPSLSRESLRARTSLKMMLFCSRLLLALSRTGMTSVVVVGAQSPALITEMTIAEKLRDLYGSKYSAA